jgi:hypothetical protein
MLAHGEARLATADDERIYLFDWHIPVHSLNASAMDFPILTARFVARSDARSESS